MYCCWSCDDATTAAADDDDDADDDADDGDGDDDHGNVTCCQHHGKYDGPSNDGTAWQVRRRSGQQQQRCSSVWKLCRVACRSLTTGFVLLNSNRHAING